LAFVALTADDEPELRRLIPTNIAIEDRTDNRWGLVVRDLNGGPAADMQTAVTSILELLDEVAEQIATYETVLRVAVYHDTVTCTFTLQNFEHILLFGTQLEVTTYPTDDLT
jgi:hypothetical protein